MTGPSSIVNPVHVYLQFEDEHWWYVARRRILRSLLDDLVAPGALVVDVGCGAGANISELARAYRCVGIDVSPQLVASASERFPDVEFICGDAPRDLGPLAGEADALLLMDVIEHIPDDLGYFAELFEAARPGAIVVLTVPADPRLWSGHDEAVGHVRRYTAAAMSRLWAGLPAEQLLLSHFNSRLHPLVAGVRRLNGMRGRVAGEHGTDFAMPPRLINSALATIMSSETAVLRGALGGGRAGFRRGVSLIGIVRKVEPHSP
jgi:SAM-dependent methyltransferase